MSNASRGAYYKLRTKKWLEARGYTVALMERVMWIPPKEPGGRPIPVKRDQLGADLLAVSATELVLVQVKSVGPKTSPDRLGAIREFAKYTVPAFVQQWVVIWKPRQREPEIIEPMKGVKGL